jgi:hypothetical protein
VKGALVLAVLAVAATAAPAFAEDPNELFKEGRELASHGDYVGACDRFERALAIDPTALGTELNLADCYEHRAQTARAWHMFDGIVAKAKAASDPSKASYARDRADKLVVQLVAVVVHVRRPIPDHLTVTIAGRAVPIGDGEIHDYADPGTITVIAKPATGAEKRTDRRGAAGATVEVEVAFPASTPQIGGDGTPHDTPVVRHRKKGYRTTSIVLASAGAGSLVTSGVLALVAHWKHDGVLDDGSCHRTDAGLACNPDGAARERSAGTFADAATVFAVAGALFVVGGVTVYEIAPKIGAHDAGVVVTARF